MTEEQFWRSNPRIISAWEEVYKERINGENNRIYNYVGNYILSALFTSIDGVINGKKAKAKYIEKPIQMFELTEEEKKNKQQDAIAQFIAWAGMAETKYKDKKGG